MVNQLRSALEAGTFAVTCELIPGRGAREKTQADAIEDGTGLLGTGRVHALSVTDNPGGNPALLADTFAEELLKIGATPLVHVTCKDRNRNQLASQFYAMERTGIENILLMSGDYPVSGYGGRPRPVFDLDPVQALGMVEALNAGERYPGVGGKEAQLTPTHLFAGAVVSPFKWTEAETITQYYKLEKKIAAGARFIISQVGYDARKMQELVWYVRDKGLDTPLIANVYILTAGVGRYMNGGNIPGSYASDELLAVLQQEKQAADKGKGARLLRAAKMVAIAHGLGYAGVHIGGTGCNAENVTYILDKAEELRPEWERWAAELSYGEPGAFYYYRRDPGVTPDVHEPSPRDEVRTDRPVRGNYRMSRAFHHMVFLEGKKMEPIVHRRMVSLEAKKGVHRKHGLEHLAKVQLYGCQDCGDCGLYAVAYSCPMSACPKCQRNGPCGGSNDGWCEVYPGERYCIWYKAYHRLKPYHEETTLGDYIVPPNNWDAFETTGWGNYHHGRDNIARRIWVTSPERDTTGCRYSIERDNIPGEDHHAGE